VVAVFKATRGICSRLVADQIGSFKWVVVELCCLALCSHLRSVGISIFLRQTQAKCAKLLEVRSLVRVIYFVRP